MLKNHKAFLDHIQKNDASHYHAFRSAVTGLLQLYSGIAKDDQKAAAKELATLGYGDAIIASPTESTRLFHRVISTT